MKKYALLLAMYVLVLVTSGTGRADVVIGDTTVVFATADEGRQVLTARDDFVSAMSAFDRAARLKTDKDVTEKDYLAFVGKNVTEWPDADKARVQAALEAIKGPLGAMGLPLPKRVLMIRTTGQEEGGAAYTRGAAIILPPGELQVGGPALQEVIAHEFFHVLSRANPELKEKAYAAIGFAKCDEVELPAALQARKITNPDAPKNDHCIQLHVGERTIWAVPILLSTAEKYNAARGGEFFEYLSFKWLVVERGAGTKVTPVVKDGAPEMLEMTAISGFLEQVGKNTNYTIHPEEILADNFKLMVTAKPAASADVLGKVREALGLKPPPKP